MRDRPDWFDAALIIMSFVILYKLTPYILEQLVLRNYLP